MKPEIEQYHRKDYSRDEGMLFVRTEGILHTMIKASLLIVGLIVIGFTIPVQNSFGLTRSLDLIVYPDGSTHVTSEIEVDVQQPDFQINLFGSTIDNFVAIGENGFLLEWSEVITDSVTIQTFGSSSVSIEYDIHDLVSKEGRIWSFKIDAPSDYSLLLPENTVIVGMSNLPQNMEILDNKSKLFLPAGQSQIDYIFSVSQIPTPDPIPPTPDPIPINENPDNSLILIGGAVIVVAGVIGIIFARMNKRKSFKPAEINVQNTLNSSTLVPETIFKLRPDLREDDKEIVSFIFENGGNVKESELRKKFLQPRTTMWRAVKRLERHGIVEIEKKDQQNLVILKDNLEEEQ